MFHNNIASCIIASLAAADEAHPGAVTRTTGGVGAGGEPGRQPPQRRAAV